MSLERQKLPGEAWETVEASNGGSLPVQAAFTTGAQTAVADGAFVDLPWGWGNELGPTNDVLDLTDPTLPVITEDGLHTFTCEFSYVSTTPKPGKVFSAYLFLDYNGFYDGPIGQIPLDSIDSLIWPKVILTTALYLTAGMVIEAFVPQNSGGQVNCLLWAWVVRS